MRRRIPKQYKELGNIHCQPFELDSSEIRTILPLSIIPKKDHESDSAALCLATQTIPLKKENLWNSNFEDIEDHFSLHRFGWLLYPLSQNISTSNLYDLKNAILDWIELNPKTENGQGWDSYSISERIVNWIYFLIIAQDHALFEKKTCHKILSILQFQSEILLNHLEFRFSGTNNHLINNGRALYLAGAFLKQDGTMSIGRDILLSCSQNMFTPSGFLNEGSSHYQVLMARTFYEVYLCAHYIRDFHFIDLIEDITKKIIRSAMYFSETLHFPAFGDVSPDFYPEFHIEWLQILSSISAKDKLLFPPDQPAWNRIFNDESILNIGKIIPQIIDDKKDIIAFPDAGHFKISKGNFTLFLYVNPMGYVPEWSHGHSDIGSFILYWNQSPVFIDTGRYSFEKTVLGLYGKSIRSHNAISIDGYEPCVTHGLNGYAQLISKNYIGASPEVAFDRNKDKIVVKVMYHGFKRIWPEIEVSRILSFHKDRIEIEDRITGSNVRSIETFFHLYPEIDISECCKENIILSMPEKVKLLLTSETSELSELKVVKGFEGEQPAGWHFPRYGIKIPTNTLIFSERTALPIKNKYVLKEI